MKIKIKKLSPDAVLPKYLHETDAGMDIVAINKKDTGRYLEYGTGLSFEIPEGYVCLVFPRSSISKKDLDVSNSVGVLDSGYRGELKIRFNSIGENHYEIGDRIAQILILPYPKIEFEDVKSLSGSDRGNKGLGSTGLN